MKIREVTDLPGFDVLPHITGKVTSSAPLRKPKISHENASSTNTDMSLLIPTVISLARCCERFNDGNGWCEDTGSAVAKSTARFIVVNYNSLSCSTAGWAALWNLNQRFWNSGGGYCSSICTLEQCICPVWKRDVKPKVCQLQDNETRSMNICHSVFYTVRIFWPTYTHI